MAKYTFKCSLGHTIQKQAPSTLEAFPCDHPYCSAVMIRQLPTLNGPSKVTEVIDKYTGRTWMKDQREEIKSRHDQHYWSVEVPRMVQSGVYSIETMLDNEWIWIDDNNQIQVYTKPRERR